MKKKILLCVFSVLILITAIVFIAGAIQSYHYDMDSANGVDVLEGFGAVVILMVGGFVVFYQADLFYVIYYFAVKPQTAARSVLNILSNVTLLLVFFTDNIARFLSEYVSQIFREEGIIAVFLFLTYIGLRVVCLLLSARP